MNNNTPLVEDIRGISASLPEATPSVQQTATSGQDLNNSLATFQNITGGDPKEFSEALAHATESEDSSASSNEKSEGSENTAVSDGRLKELFGESGIALADCMARLDAYVYKYNEKARSIPEADKKGVDDNIHFGPIAQELKDNPLTQDSVEEDPLTGYLEVNTKRLTLTDTAVLSELCKRVIALEKRLGEGNGNKE